MDDINKRKIFTYIAILVGVLAIAIFLSSQSKSEIYEGTSKKPLIIAHRGASTYEPEHSYPSYDKAVNDMDVDYLELDLQETKDKNLIAMHDSKLDRTTNTKGNIKDFTIQQISKLKLKDDKNRNLTVPVFDDILDKYKGKTKFYIELKNAKANPGMAKLVADKLKKHGLLNSENVVIQSFDANALKEMHNIDSTIPLVKLMYDSEVPNLSDNSLDEYSEYCYAIGLSTKSVNQSIIDKIEKHHMQAHVFTVDNKDEYQKLKDMKVKGFFTNIGDDLVK
ncbi:putative glycerophosphoryl diester phosphodiesterase [Staphylococcus simiae CCM 7213 = CCUG 51256]|uniref:Putative glycerophosphoryl diester phosphodiesterase n=1 Tax=Staphylococcus simiae CCM 7213 = CCUG 51256 TaxID=911238 RepID=G5JHA6_9STAP|nr:putative glycerophosphoryl diester phosphodiesterase [Staphylococcus simiae CCM 7213 = CCUG 51256]